MFSRMKEDISCILERDPAARSRLEIVTCYPGLHAIWVHRMAHRLWVSRWHWLARLVSHLGRVFTGIEIHPGATFGRRVFIDHGHGVVIGETAVVGDDCTIYQGVTLGGTRLYKGEKRHPTLGTGVVVGAGAKVLGGFEVGDGARIGSNAVVVKPVPAGATAVGNPARVILPQADADSSHTAKPSAVPTSQAQTTADCDQASLDTKPLQDMLAAQASRPEQRSNEGNESTDSGDSNEQKLGDGDGFSAYGVNLGDTDPLVRVLHELIDHTAKQDARISQLCLTIESMGKRVNGAPDDELDAERLNKLVD